MSDKVSALSDNAKMILLIVVSDRDGKMTVERTRNRTECRYTLARIVEVQSGFSHRPILLTNNGMVKLSRIKNRVGRYVSTKVLRYAVSCARGGGISVDSGFDKYQQLNGSGIAQIQQ